MKRCEVKTSHRIFLLLFNKLLYVLGRTDAPVTALTMPTARTAAIATGDATILFIFPFFDNGTDDYADDEKNTTYD